MEETGRDSQQDGTGGSEVPTKSLEHTWRLRNLLEISILLTNYESAEETVPAVLELFSRTLSLQSTIALIGPGVTYAWRAPNLGDADFADALEQARTSFQYFSGAPHDPADSVYARRGVRTRKEGDADCITLPIATKKERVVGLVQVIGHQFDEPDLLYLNAAVNQLALAVRRDVRTQERLARRDAKTATAELGKFSAETQRDEAKHAKVLQETLLAVVSHDLKNPLSAILINAEFMLSSSKLSKNDRRKVEFIQGAAERMSRMTNDLLDWANMEKGKLSIMKIPVRLDELVNEALGLMAPIIQKKEIQLDADVFNGEAQIWCDRDRILQVFSNLLGNAVKFTPKGGKLKLRALGNPNETVFSITDTGPGIPLDAQDHVFERFWQHEEHAHAGSAGLGLAITKGLVEAHGGRVWFTSEPGQGTSFFFTLPRPERALLE